MKLFKKDLVDNKDGMQSEWKKANKEAIRQKATGRKRVNHDKISLVKTTSAKQEVREPRKRFYTTTAFKRKFGIDPKKQS